MLDYILGEMGEFGVGVLQDVALALGGGGVCSVQKIWIHHYYLILVDLMGMYSLENSTVSSNGPHACKCIYYNKNVYQTCRTH